MCLTKDLMTKRSLQVKRVCTVSGGTRFLQTVWYTMIDSGFYLRFVPSSSDSPRHAFVQKYVWGVNVIVLKTLNAILYIYCRRSPHIRIYISIAVGPPYTYLYIYCLRSPHIRIYISIVVGPPYTYLYIYCRMSPHICIYISIVVGPPIYVFMYLLS
jgi:hypothetical protein